ncbi:MAG: S1 RNA-binding domain-containing protein [Firmicutes bacterium]|nr:S1 RNA-binding domain-containing protein [Bacillota bacterium]
MAESMNDFYEMFEASMKPIHNGDMLEGTVVEVGAEAAILDLGSYMDGILPDDQLEAGETLNDLKVGQKIRVAVRRVDTRNSQIMLSKRDADRVIAWRDLTDHQKEGSAVLVKVESAVKGGLRVRCGSASGFMPASQVDLAYHEDLSEFVGQELKAEIMEVDPEKKDFTCSRKRVLLKEREMAKERLFQTLKEGDRRKGKVVELRPYGAFVEIEDGVTGLLHVSDMSWSRISHPSDVVSIGDLVEVGVTRVDPDNQRISLSLKAVMDDPWSMLDFGVGSILTDKEVLRIISSGAFIHLTDAIDGFLPISQISEKRLRNVGEVLKVGQKVTVRVVSIRPEEHRISLSMKDIDQETGEAYPEELSFYSTDGDEAPSTNLGGLLSGLSLEE